MPNPINPDFMKNEYKGELRDEIVTVGRIDDNKNQAMLVEAFSHIACEFPDVKVFIYGEGSAKEQVEKLIQQKGLKDRVILAGHQADIKSKIQGARIFVLTSKVEGMPNAMIEAMTQGLVPISTDFKGGGVRQLIQDGENGFIVPVDNVHALAGCLRCILSNKEVEEKMRISAVQIREKLNPKVVDRQWKDYFEQFIKV